MEGSAMVSVPSCPPEAPQVRWGWHWRLLIGIPLLMLGCLAVATPFVAGKSSPFVLAILMLTSGLIETAHAFAMRDRHVGNAVFFGAAMSVLAGLLLLAQPKLALGALSLLLGVSFLIDGVGMIVAATRSSGRPGVGLLSDGCLKVLLGLLIASQWPVSGLWTIGLYVGCRILGSGWSKMLGRDNTSGAPGVEVAASHPDPRLRLPPHPELDQLRDTLSAADVVRYPIDRYWRATFLLTFLAIHIGRMEAEWNLVGLFSPGVAVIGDVLFALMLAWGVITPVRLGWRALTRPIERRSWTRLLAQVDQGQKPGRFDRLVRYWLNARTRFAWRLSQARRSPTVAVRCGLQIGLPVTAVLIALNPIWGFSWYFNTENWATEVWARWAEQRTDTWREQMVHAVRERYPDTHMPGAQLFQVVPEGIAAGVDFSFLVIGDPGEGDASQHILRDQFIELGQRSEVKFLIVASDVIYPAGAMKDYEEKFYLPFKGFTKPIYAIPGNHDWYDALEGFTANFLEPEAARAALRARRATDHGLTTTTESRINQIIEEAARLRETYGVWTGGQRAPYFEVDTEHFVLIAVDTGILRRVDTEQLRWLRAALEQAKGKFKMVILGHPLFAAGYYQGAGDEPFAAIHQLLHEHAVEVVMAGDTHDFEFYKEVDQARSQNHPMYHVVNGGGGAYLSIGTALNWPKQVPTAAAAFYPRTEAVLAKLDSQTPRWKWPLWWWMTRLGAWPSAPEALASAFDFNQAPFFQSFVEVRVEGSANVVRLLLFGANGRLRWRDLQIHGQVMPDGQDDRAFVEFSFPLAVTDNEARP
jgi:uncharacterized membrane protein HdeD (DUF308 family)